MRMQCHCDKRRIPFGAIETASNTDSDSSFAVCILKLNAEKPLGSLNDGHSTLADFLIYCRKCCAQIYSPPIGGKHDSFIPG